MVVYSTGLVEHCMSNRSSATWSTRGVSWHQAIPLVRRSSPGTNLSSFDMTGDGQVNHADLNSWLAIAGAVNNASGNPYRPGDGNLDGVVDGSDFGIWNANKFTGTAALCSGDFNADGVVDGSDFGIWNANKFTSSDATAVVPEPALFAMAIPALLLLTACRPRRTD